MDNLRTYANRNPEFRREFPDWEERWLHTSSRLPESQKTCVNTQESRCPSPPGSGPGSEFADSRRDSLMAPLNERSHISKWDFHVPPSYSEGIRSCMVSPVSAHGVNISLTPPVSRRIGNETVSPHSTHDNEIASCIDDEWCWPITSKDPWQKMWSNGICKTTWNTKYQRSHLPDLPGMTIKRWLQMQAAFKLTAGFNSWDERAQITFYPI